MMNVPNSDAGAEPADDDIDDDDYTDWGAHTPWPFLPARRQPLPDDYNPTEDDYDEDRFA